MIVISHYRNKCIGCNACVEFAAEFWRMSRKDGKSTLIGAIEKRGVYTLKIDDIHLSSNQKASAACPVNVIKIKKL